MDIVIQPEPFNSGEELNKFTKRVCGAGAVVSFSGMVRDIPGRLDLLNIEHYPGMAEKAINQVCEEAYERWNLIDALVIHRFGTLKKGELIMMVITASPTRIDAFNAAEFLMDFLKSYAPFWKKEISENGSSWVEARDKDKKALDRWDKS
jgi:molybdopterin synthase catalytic subunit